MSSPNVRVRPLADGDADTVRHVFDGLSTASRHLRYHAPLHRLPDRFAQQLAVVDRDHLVYVAEVHVDAAWQIAGIVRAVRTDEAEAEIAVEVVDRFQGYGVGRRLLDALIVGARRAGLRTFVGHVLASNTVMRHLWSSTFPGTRSVASGTGLTLRAPIPAGRQRRHATTRPSSRPPRAPQMRDRHTNETSLTTQQGGEG